MTTISYGQIIEWGAMPDCEQIARLRQRYPDGVPLTRAVGRELLVQGYPVVDFAVRLLDEEATRAFILFTLRQRQPHLVTLFRAAGLPEHAEAIAALTWDDLTRAQSVLATAATWAATAASWAATHASWAATHTPWAATAADDASWAVRQAVRAAGDAEQLECIAEQLEWISDRLSSPK